MEEEVEEVEEWRRRSGRGDANDYTNIISNNNIDVSNLSIVTSDLLAFISLKSRNSLQCPSNLFHSSFLFFPL